MKKSKTVQLRPGWVILDTSSATGGIEYTREKIGERLVNRRRGVQADHTTRQVVDNVEFCAAIDAVVKKVDYALRTNCARTKAGDWFADHRGLAHVRTAVVQIAAEAAGLNARAKLAKSERRAEIGIWPLRIDVHSEEAAHEILRTIRGSLSDIHRALRKGRIAELHKLRIRSINLDRFVMGEQSLALHHALTQVPHATRELRGALRTVKDLSDADMAYACARAGEQLNLEDIEKAITLFRRGRKKTQQAENPPA